MSDPLELRPTKIVCVGKSYPDHARELGSEPPLEPLLFLKPPSALIGNGDEIRIPPGIGRVDFEGEVAFQVGKRASRVSADEASEYLSGVLPLNDVTARDLQKRDGQWTRAKGFDTFCPVGTPVPLESVDLNALRIETRVNDEVKQDTPFSDALFSIDFLVQYISKVMTLEPGDLIATGTPAGVGSVVPWDDVEVVVHGVGSVRSPVRAGRGEPWPYTVGGGIPG